MPTSRYLSVIISAAIASAALGCGAGATGDAPDAAAMDAPALDATMLDTAAADSAAADADAPATDGAPEDRDEVVCAGDRWGGSAEMLEAIVDCTVIAGNLSITGNQLSIVELPRLTRVDGFLTVWGNPILTRAAFAALETIGGYLDVSSNATLTSLELPALKSVNRRALVVANDVLIRDNALPECQTDAIRAQLEAHGLGDKVSIVADGVPCPP